MRHLILLFTFLCTLNTCAQNQQQSNVMKQNMDMKTIADSVGKFVKRYDYEPLYYVAVNTNACFSILVNDKPLFTYFGSDIGGISFQANKAIFQSGKQELKTIVYPRYIYGGTQQATLSDDIEFEVIITERSWIKGEGGLTEPKVVFSYNLSNDKKNLSGFTDLAKYEKITYFKANVPYKLVGWSKSKDLTQINRDKLFKDVLRFYERHLDCYKNRKVEDIENIEFTRTCEGAQATYLTQDEVVKRMNATATFYDEYKDIEWLPLENYEMQFFGDGRMVALIRIDGKNRGESALRHRFTSDLGRKRISILDLYLHIPEGSDELELIR